MNTTLPWLAAVLPAWPPVAWWLLATLLALVAAVLVLVADRLERARYARELSTRPDRLFVLAARDRWGGSLRPWSPVCALSDETTAELALHALVHAARPFKGAGVEWCLWRPAAPTAPPTAPLVRLRLSARAFERATLVALAAERDVDDALAFDLGHARGRLRVGYDVARTLARATGRDVAALFALVWEPQWVRARLSVDGRLTESGRALARSLALWWSPTLAPDLTPQTVAFAGAEEAFLSTQAQERAS